MGLPEIEEAIGDSCRIAVLGSTDTGKSFLVQSLVKSFRSKGERVIHMDLDMGQSTIGPPTTIGFVRPDGTQSLYFVGNITPYGIFREIERGIRLLRKTMKSFAYDRTFIDTPGLVLDVFARNLAKMEMKEAESDFVILLDRRGETSHIADGLRELGVQCRTFAPFKSVRKKSYLRRGVYRTNLFLDYFRQASEAKVTFQGRKIIHLGKQEEEGLLVGICDSSGFLLTLGLLLSIEEEGIIVVAQAFSQEETKIIKFGRYSIDLK